MALLAATPGLRPIVVLEEMQRRHPERDLGAARRTLALRMRAWRAEHGPEQEVIFRQAHPPDQQACRTSLTRMISRSRSRGYRVLMVRTSDLVQRLETARRDLALTQEIAKLDRFDLLILDDLSYVRKDQTGLLPVSWTPG